MKPFTFLRPSRSFAVRLLVCLAVSAAFLLLFAQSTSPLFKNRWIYDSAFFILVGRGMTQGMLPYRDFFDMKGPYLFLWEWIGQKLCSGRTGAFILEIVSQTVCLLILCRLFRMFTRRRRTVVSGIACCLILLCIVFQSGNMTEEYALPFLLPAVLFFLRYMRAARESGDWKHSPKIALLYGLFAGVIFLTRITNATILGAAVLTSAVCVLLHREYRNLLVNAGMFLVGLGIAFAPMCIYYASQGLLSEMFSQVFGFGFRYASESNLARELLHICSSRSVLGLFPIFLPLAVLLWRRDTRWEAWLFSALCGSFTLLAVCMGNGYGHYFVLAVPDLALAFCLGIEPKNSRRRRVPRKAAVCALLAAGIAVGGAVRLLDVNVRGLWDNVKLIVPYQTIGKDFTDVQALDILRQIPPEDRNSVYAFNIQSASSWYGVTGLTPPNRYCDWQKHYIELVPPIGEELVGYLQSGGAKWAVEGHKENLSAPLLTETVQEYYEPVYATQKYTLYKYTGQNEKGE